MTSESRILGRLIQKWYPGRKITWSWNLSQPCSFHSRDSLLDKNCTQLSPIQLIKKIIFWFLWCLLCRYRNKKTCSQPRELTETKTRMKFYVSSAEKQVGRLPMWETAFELNLGRPVDLKYAKRDWKWHGFVLSLSYLFSVSMYFLLSDSYIKLPFTSLTQNASGCTVESPSVPDFQSLPFPLG